MLSTLLRGLALYTTLALVASLAVIANVASVTAQPTCDGRLVTITDNGPGDQNGGVGEITGTNGPDVILGTDGDDTILGRGGNDHICGGRGDDRILGGDGNDRLFGGGGDDRISGLRGRDAIFGFAGSDQLLGGHGRDFINGGPGADTIWGNSHDDVLIGRGGTDLIGGGKGHDRIDGGAADDECRQGPRLRRCEEADLGVRIIGPSSPSREDFSFKVRVRNLGPDATTYTLFVSDVTTNTECHFPQEDQPQTIRALAPGATRTRVYQADCTLTDGVAYVRLRATVRAHARDANDRNDRHEPYPAIRLE